MAFHAFPISLAPLRQNGLLVRLIARHEADFGDALRRLLALRAELAAIQRLRERGIDAVSRDRLTS